MFDARVQRTLRTCTLLLVCAAAVLITIPSTAAPAQQRYRYVNDQGVVVLDQSIPSQYIDRGYTVLGADGRVVRVVPSAAERKKQEAQAKVAEAERKVQEDRAQTDQELMRMYSSIDDIERARDRKLDSIRTAIAITQGNLRRLVAQKKNIEDQGALMERAGRPVPPESVRNLKIVSGQIRDRQIEINLRKAEFDRVRAAFDMNTHRLRELYLYDTPEGGPAGGSNDGSNGTNGVSRSAPSSAATGTSTGARASH